MDGRVWIDNARVCVCACVRVYVRAVCLTKTFLHRSMRFNFVSVEIIQMLLQSKIIISISKRCLILKNDLPTTVDNSTVYTLMRKWSMAMAMAFSSLALILLTIKQYIEFTHRWQSTSHWFMSILGQCFGFEFFKSTLLSFRFVQQLWDACESSVLRIQSTGFESSTFKPQNLHHKCM